MGLSYKFTMQAVIKIISDVFLLQEQFFQYWPSNVGERISFNGLTVKLLSEEDRVDFSIRELDLSFKDCNPTENSEVKL